MKVLVLDIVLLVVKLGGAGKNDPPLTIDLQGQEQATLYPLVERYQTFGEYSQSFMLPLLLYETWESVSVKCRATVEA